MNTKRTTITDKMPRAINLLGLRPDYGNTCGPSLPSSESGGGRCGMEWLNLKKAEETGESIRFPKVISALGGGQYLHDVYGKETQRAG